MKLEKILQCTICGSLLKTDKRGYICLKKHRFLFINEIPNFISREDKKKLEKEFKAQKNSVWEYKDIETEALLN